MGQGIKYSIAAVGTLLLLTILSWSADEQPKQESKAVSSGMVMEGGTLNTGPKAVSVKPLSTPVGVTTIEAPKAEAKPVQVTTNLLSSKPTPTKVDYSGNAGAKPSAVTTSLLGQASAGTPSKPMLAGSAAPSSKLAKAPKTSEIKVNSSKQQAVPDRTTWQKYSVRPGETLYAIARKTMGNGMRWKDIMKANPRLKSPGHLRTGMTLLIPSAEAFANSHAKPSSETIAVRKPQKTVPSEEANAGDHEVAVSQTYVVQAGDTLSRIAARKMGSRKKWKTLFNANRGLLKSPNHLRTGQKLVIPAH